MGSRWHSPSRRARRTPGPAGTGSATCTYDQDRDRLQPRDGTGPQHDAIVSGTTVTGNGHSFQAGPHDGTGNQFGR